MHKLETCLHDGLVTWAIGVTHYTLNRADVRWVGTVRVDQQPARIQSDGGMPADGGLRLP